MTNIIQLKITLQEVKPPVWRRIMVQDDIDFYQLHQVIQTAMGWRNIHSFGFDLKDYYMSGSKDYEGNIEMEFSPYKSLVGLTQEERVQYIQKVKEYRSKEKLMINNFIKFEKQRIKYSYNFSYKWDHTLLVEKIIQPEEGKNYPVCIKGKRACPPDSINLEVRDAIGYMIICDKFLENPNSKNQQYFKEEYRKLYKRDFDPEYFNMDEINDKLEVLSL